MDNGPIIPYEPGADAIVAPGRPLERLGDSCAFTEGPWYDAAHDRVLFTDIPGNRILSWSDKSGLTPFTDRSHFAIGLYGDAAGRLLACEHTTRRLVRYRSDPTARDAPTDVEVLAASWRGYALNSPNDVVYRSSTGAIYFTDPPFGVREEDGELHGYQQGMEYGACGVFRVGETAADPDLVARSIYRPNGLCFSVHEDRLYVSDSSDRHHGIYYLPVTDGEPVDTPVPFAVVEHGVPDGMRVDRDDRLYVAVGNGVNVYDRSGGLLALIPVPEMVTNLCFGGPDRSDLYITAVTSLYRIRLTTQGVHR